MTQLEIAVRLAAAALLSNSSILAAKDFTKLAWERASELLALAKDSSHE